MECLDLPITKRQVERNKEQFLVVSPASKRTHGKGQKQQGIIKEEEVFCSDEDNIQNREEQAECQGVQSQEESEVSVLGQDDS